MKDPNIAMPPQASAVIKALESAGHEAWCVGGFVRDALMGKSAHDVDIAASAHWTQVKATLEGHGASVFETGTKHGTVTVALDKTTLEVTTYRYDGDYGDGRHPNQVTFVQSIEEDLARRDFTMNAMAWHPKRGLFDPFGGRADIEKGVIRAVGDPAKRFNEDALRILRGIRFASQLGFPLDGRTEAAARELANLTKFLSAERVFNEIDKMLKGRYARKAVSEYCDVISVTIPELKALEGFDQKSPYHHLDALEHTAAVVEGTPADSALRWAALLHDAGKPACFTLDENGIGHFYGHAAHGETIVGDVSRRLKFPTSLAQKVKALVAHHDDDPPRSRRALRRAVRSLGGDADLFASLCALQTADALAHAPGKQNRAQLAQEALRLLDEELADQAVFSRKDLAISGSDLISMGFPPGPLIGSTLEKTLDLVIDGRIENDLETLKAYIAQNFFQKSLD